jgi:aspartokinase
MDPMECSSDEDEDPYFGKAEFEKQLQIPLLSSKGGKIIDIEWTAVLMKGVTSERKKEKRFNPTGLLALQADRHHNVRLGYVQSKEKLDVTELTQKQKAKEMYKLAKSYNKTNQMLREKIVAVRYLRDGLIEQTKVSEALLCELAEKNIEIGMEGFQNFEIWNA